MSDAKPSDIIIKFLKEIVESWEKKAYSKAADQCNALLKRKKTVQNLGLKIPLQRIMLQAHLHQQKYKAVMEWGDRSQTNESGKDIEGCEDLVMYAKYRNGDYGSVSKQAGDAAEAASGTNAAVAFMNLQAQSYHHLNRTEEGLAIYRELLKGNTLNETDIESKMEVLTNALGLIASSGCTPTVAVEQEKIRAWLDEATSTLLSEEIDPEILFENELARDLASNLGCIRTLTDPTISSEHDWLSEAVEKTEDAPTKLTFEQTNWNWSKHFWYKDLEEVNYTLPTKTTSLPQLSVVESIAMVNQSLLDESLSRLAKQPHPKWNLFQVKLYWYNRAVLQLKAEQYVECQDSCQSLKKALVSSFSTGNHSKKKTKSSAVVPKSKTSPETLWWEARADVVLAYAQQGQAKQKDATTRLTERLETLKAAATALSSSSFVLDHAIAHVMLHQFALGRKRGGSKKDRRKEKRETLKLLQSLPESIQSRPAVQLTIDDLQNVVENDDSNHADNNGTESTPKSPLEKADLLFGQGQYEEACKLYEDALSPSTGETNNHDSKRTMDSQLRYVQALAMSGQHEVSNELWQSLQSALLEEEATGPTIVSSSLPDGNALEEKALPRSSKSSTFSKNLSVADTASEENKPSREKILRRRARKREAYLKELERKGKYNPDRPTKPDPERWIPKHERSRKQRGGRNHSSAQGGGSRLDAQRLDAAARRAGKFPATNGPSSANLKVSSGGRKGGRRR